MEHYTENPSSFQWGTFQLSEEDSESHFIAIGTTGSGKTLILRILQQSVLPHVGTGKGVRGLVYDAKHDAIPILSAFCDSSRIKILNPFDLRGVAWDIAKDVNRSACAMEAAFILIPEVADHSPFFRNAARHAAWGCMSSFTLSGLDWGFSDLLRALRSDRNCRRVLSRHPQTNHLVNMYMRDKKLSNDIFATIASVLMLYEPIAASWDSANERVAISDCMEEEYILVLGNTEVSRTTINRLNAVQFKRWTDLILPSPRGHRNDFGRLLTSFLKQVTWQDFHRI